MFTENDLQELLDFRAKNSMLSIYLNTDPTQGSADGYKLRLRNMLKEVDRKEDVEAVERYFDFEYDWYGKAVAVFSCQSADFFRAYSFAVPIQNRIRIGERPHVKPLADLLDAYGGYGVVLVDKQDARLFYFHLGELQEEEDLRGTDIRRTKRGGSSQFPGRRGGIAGRTNYVEEATERNLKDTAELATRFFAEKNVRRVLIGGTDETVNQFRNHLPKSWQSLVVGTFPIQKTASQSEVLEIALEVGLEADRKREAQLLNMIVTSAAKGHGGVVDLEDTLNALHDGRIQVLVIREGYRAPGFRCEGCSYLTSEKISECPFCGNVFEKIPDAVELAVSRVLRSGGDVEVIRSSNIHTDFKDMGATLRY